MYLVFTLWQLLKEDFLIKQIFGIIVSSLVTFKTLNGPKRDFSNEVDKSPSKRIITIAQNMSTCHLLVSVCCSLTYQVAQLTFLLSSGRNNISKLSYIGSLEYVLLF